MHRHCLRVLKSKIGSFMDQKDFCSVFVSFQSSPFGSSFHSNVFIAQTEYVQQISPISLLRCGRYGGSEQEGGGEGGGGRLARLVAFLSLFTQPFLATRGRELVALGRWLLTLRTTTGPFVEELHQGLIDTCESGDRLLRADRKETKAKGRQTWRAVTSLCSTKMKTL